MTPELSSVADDFVIVHRGPDVSRYDGLQPSTEHVLDGVAVRTLPRPGGQLLCTFATVNDVHFGEVACGAVDDDPTAPVLRVAPGEPPYPESMNRAACAEMTAIDPAAVIVKGDLTDTGTDEQYQAFLDCYVGTFGARLHHVRGNHDAYLHQTYATGDQLIEMPGVSVALLDTVIPGKSTGRVTAEQMAWLDTVATEADRPVLVMGHHQNWAPGTKRSDDYFGLDPSSSEALVEVIARRPRLVGYFAGHTHRNRVRTTGATGTVPYVEVATVKDFPGSWAEYRVYDGGILQVHHRISTPDALAWSERCRTLYAAYGLDYSAYALGHLEDRCFPIWPR